MRIEKTVVSLVLALVLLLCPMIETYAAGDIPRGFSREEALAISLKALGLFQGISDTDFALDRAPTRAEAVVMLLRLLGLEQDALSTSQSHPFMDTTGYAWADPYIGYAYSTGLTKGQSETVFGGNDTADAQTYLTFVLRALGYKEGINADFTWERPYPLARRLGLLPVQVQTYNFLRADVVSVSYAALNAVCKDTGKTLGDKLINKGVLTRKALNDYYDPSVISTGKFTGQIADNLDGFIRPYRIAGGIDISGLNMSYHDGVMQIGDAAYELYGFYAAGLEHVAKEIRTGAEAVSGRAAIYSIIAPNRLGAVLSYDDYSRICNSSKTETEAISYAYSQMGRIVQSVDAVSELRVHNTEEIYYRTDHHWTALGAYYAYVAWARTAGLTPVPLNSYARRDAEGHLGMFYSLCDYPAVMKQNPDTVTAYIPRSDIMVDITEADGTTHSGELIYDVTGYAFKYGTFIGGDHPLTTITNNDIADKSACLLVKDSYGNPFSIYLTQHYHTVYVIDYRYYSDVQDYLTFSRFVDECGVKDIIVLLPMTLSQNDYTASYLKKYCK